MSDKIKLTCPRCKHKWDQLIGDLEKLEIIYKGVKKKANKEIVKYRAQCPHDGTYVIVEVEED
jgi:hypothetical protein